VATVGIKVLKASSSTPVVCARSVVLALYGEQTGTKAHTQDATHAPETGVIDRLHFLAPITGACVVQISDRILLDVLVPDSGAD